MIVRRGAYIRSKVTGAVENANGGWTEALQDTDGEAGIIIRVDPEGERVLAAFQVEDARCVGCQFAELTNDICTKHRFWFPLPVELTTGQLPDNFVLVALNDALEGNDFDELTDDLQP